MNDLWLKLQQKLSDDYEQYLADMMAKDKSEIIKNAERIGFMQRIYNYLKNDTLMDKGYVEYLIKFKNPLIVLHEQFMAEDFSIAADFAAKLDATLHTMIDHDDLDEDYEMDTEYYKPEPDKGVEMC